MWGVVRDIVFGHRSWERVDLFDDDIAFFTREFWFPHGMLRVNLVFECGALTSIHSSFDDVCGVEYSCIDGQTTCTWARYTRRGGRVDKIDTRPMDSTFERPPWEDMDLAHWVHCAALHPVYRQLLTRNAPLLYFNM